MRMGRLSAAQSALKNLRISRLDRQRIARRKPPARKKSRHIAHVAVQKTSTLGIDYSPLDRTARTCKPASYYEDGLMPTLGLVRDGPRGIDDISDGLEPLPILVEGVSGEEYINLLGSFRTVRQP